MGRKGTLEDRFWRGVKRGEEDACWEWQRFRQSRGYGVLCGSDGRTPTGAHRISWTIHNGPIPDGIYVCHSCDNPPCCNPDHLFLGTAKDNFHDALNKGRYQPWNKGIESSDRCSRGHLFTGARDSRGNRKCLTCRRERQRERRAGLR